MVKKVRLFNDHQFMRENAEYNLRLNKAIVKKVKSVTSREESGHA